MALEYLIRPIDDDWFNLAKSNFGRTLRPDSFEFSVIEGWGDHRIRINDVEVAFSYEDLGIQISFEGIANVVFADKVVGEILSNIEKTTGQSGRIIPL
ncbi:MAG: hypothetical protein KJ069_23945 [Anaerolineae bacterium]|nr:hypothetical protein [Anaerolineae bacterium]